MSFRTMARSLLRRTNKPYRLTSVTVGGVTFRLPIIEGSARSHQRHAEPEIFAIYTILLHEFDGAFVDIGANVGQTLLKVKAVDPGRSYIGFEPSSLSVYCIDALIRENDLIDATVIPVAACNKLTAVDLHFNSQHDAAATTVDDFWSGALVKRNRRRILGLDADSLLKAYGVNAICAIKIDVEGGELEALQGLRGTITAKRPMIVIEVLPASCDGQGPSVDKRLSRIKALIELLDEIGYRSFRLVEGLPETREFDSETYVPRDSNYLLAPMERSMDDLSQKYAEAVRLAVARDTVRQA